MASARRRDRGAELARRKSGGASDLSGLQRRLNDAGNAASHSVLQVENVMQMTIEAVGPQMRSRCTSINWAAICPCPPD